MPPVRRDERRLRRLVVLLFVLFLFLLLLFFLLVLLVVTFYLVLRTAIVRLLPAYIHSVLFGGLLPLRRSLVPTRLHS